MNIGGRYCEDLDDIFENICHRKQKFQSLAIEIKMSREA